MMAEYNVCFLSSEFMHCFVFFQKKMDNREFFMEVFKRRIEVKTNMNEISQNPINIICTKNILPHR